MEGDSDEELRRKFVQVLAKAASNREFLEKLKADPDKTLEEEGVTDGGFIIPISDEENLRAIIRIFEELGGILYKRR